MILKVRKEMQDGQVNLSVADVARDMGYSESQLRARFRKATGLSLERYLREA